jgi:hypothetical protein
MRKHKEAQEGHVKLNVGGYRFEESVQTLRHVPNIFRRYGTRRTYVAMAASLWTGTASTSGTFSNTYA